MSNAGNPEPHIDFIPHSVGFASWAWLTGLLGFILCGLAIASQTIGPLIALVSPPPAPLPAAANPLNITVDWNGVPARLYETGQSWCEIAVFYEEAGGNCIPAFSCGVGPETEVTVRAIECTAVQAFSQFYRQWAVSIAIAPAGEPTRFMLATEISWSAPAPDRFRRRVIILTDEP